MKEQQVVDLVENHLDYKQRFYLNVHGSTYSQNGTPDFVTMDKDNRFVGIECKVDGKKLVINQLRKAFEILKSGGRFIVAVSDFDIDNVDNKKLPILDISKYKDEFDEELTKIRYNESIELVYGS